MKERESCPARPVPEVFALALALAFTLSLALALSLALPLAVVGVLRVAVHGIAGSDQPSQGTTDIRAFGPPKVCTPRHFIWFRNGPRRKIIYDARITFLRWFTFISPEMEGLYLVAKILPSDRPVQEETGERGG